MRYGLDYLGGAKYADIIARSHPNGFAAGFFANTFGAAWNSIENLLATRRCPEIRVHAVYEANHLYVRAKHLPIIKREAARAVETKKKYPSVDVQFSPFCEHRIKGADLAEIFNLLKRDYPSLVRVNNPEPGKGDLYPGVINETHGNAAKLKEPYNFSYDGVSCVDSNATRMKAKHATSRTFYWWVPQFNLRKNVGDTTPIAERKAIPTTELINSIVYLRNERGEVSLPTGGSWIWKSHADQHEAPIPEPRASKPVLITPVRAARFELVAANGQVVQTLPYYGTFSGGGYRYYADEFGYLVSDKAMHVQGSPVLRLRAGTKFYGKVNAAFRAGTFR